MFWYLAVLNNLENFWEKFCGRVLISCGCTKLGLHFKRFPGNFHSCSWYSSFKSFVFALNLCPNFPFVSVLHGDMMIISCLCGMIDGRKCIKHYLQAGALPGGSGHRKSPTRTCLEPEFRLIWESSDLMVSNSDNH